MQVIQASFGEGSALRRTLWSRQDGYLDGRPGEEATWLPCRRASRSTVSRAAILAPMVARQKVIGAVGVA